MEEKEIQIVKRDGETDIFKIGKITKILEWACEGIDDVVPDHILYNAKLNIFEGIKSSEIHQILVDSAASLIDKEVNYTKVAASLMSYKLRKEVWGGKNPPKLYDLIKKGIKKGFYDPELIKIYTKAQINKLDEYIKHDRDGRFEYGGLLQLTEKYLVQNRNTKEIVETPQFAYMMASMALCIKESPRQRVKWVKEFYDDFSNHKINVSTPIMSGARTRVRSYSSCCIIDVDDTKHSITSSVTSSVLVTADKYGIGLNFSKMRSINEPIRGGEASHGGVIPWLKLSQAAIQASQQGPRRGAGTCTFFAMHPEIETILQLKDTLLPEDRKVEHLDYSIAMTNLFYHRLLEGGDITLCSYNQAPEVYKAYGTPFFNDLYEAWERDNPNAPKITAERFFSLLAKQRSETARIYIYNIDENFTNSAWLPRVEAYNLCVAGDQRVPTSRGMKRVKDLVVEGGDLTLTDGKADVSASPMTLRERDVDVYEITLANGLKHKITDYHKIKTIKGDVKLKNLTVGDKVAFQTKVGVFGDRDMSDEAFLLGLYQSDGTQSGNVIMLDIWENDFDILEEVKLKFDKIHYKYGVDKSPVHNQYGKTGGIKNIKPANFHDCDTGVSNVKKKRLEGVTLKRSLDFKKGFVPEWIWESNEETQWEYVRGLMVADGSACLNTSKGLPLYVSYTETNLAFLEELQLLFLNLGLSVSIHNHSDEGYKDLPDGKGGIAKYFCKKSYRLVLGNKNDGKLLESKTRFLSRKGVELEDRIYRDNSKKHSKVVSISHIGVEDVYCCEVYNDEHHWVCNGVITHNCQEVGGPTIPEAFVGDPNAETVVCVLSAPNACNIEDDADHKRVISNIVRILDNVIDVQEYTIAACKKYAENKRSLGVGISNLTGWLALQGLNHSSIEAPQLISDFFEKQQYYLIEASIELAKERGVCKDFKQSKYSKGIMPVDRYNKNVDEFLDSEHKLDWDKLRALVLKFGMRHCTLSAFMPCEASSVVQSSTNGFEPIRDLVVYKESKTALTIVVAPNVKTHGHHYVRAYDAPNNDGYIKVVAVLTKWSDMGVSGNLYYNPAHFEGGIIPQDVLIQDILTATRYGWRTFYYQNTDDGDKEVVESGCAGGACSL